jgi:hypothetical protein
LVFGTGFGLGKAVGVDAGLDDVAGEGEPVDDRSAETGFGEGAGPAGEGLVAGDGDAVLLFAFGKDLEEELGYMELDKRGADLLFQVLTDREETASVAIASNESFGGWTRTFTEPRLCAAIVDRLTFNATIIETGTSSYRMAHGRAKTQIGDTA